MKKKTYLILLTALGISLGISGPETYADDASWKLHPIFDEEVTHVVETPRYVYFTSRNLVPGGQVEVYSSLFRFDRQGEELQALSTSNILNSTSVRDMVYNPVKGYLAVLYKDYTIDFIYNDGKVVTMPYYEQADITYPKNVNSLAIDWGNDCLYLSTEFGYLTVNDVKHEIAESRIYGEPLRGFCRLGSDYLIVNDDKLMAGGLDSPRLSLDQYQTVATVPGAGALYPVNENICLLVTEDANPHKIFKVTKNGAGYDLEEIFNGYLHNIENTSKGVSIATGGTMFFMDKEGGMHAQVRHEDFRNSAMTTSDMTNFWVGEKRKGLSAIKYANNSWSMTRNWMRPNAPATFATTSFANHPNYGFLMLDYGYVSPTVSLYTYSPLQLSGYRQGRWTNYAPAYTNPSKTGVMYASNGMALDPDNNNFVYISSYHNGVLRLNLSNPQDIVHLDVDRGSGSSASGNALPPTQMNGAGWWNIYAPYFDKQGNLWMNYANYDDTADPNPHFYVWLAEDRKATTSQNDIKWPKEVEFDTFFEVSNQSKSIPLLKTGNGLLVYAGGLYDEKMALIDTNGTPVDTSDDKIYNFNNFTDSDGNSVEVITIRYIWEDPATGYVWVCHRNGVFYMIPSQVRQGDYSIYRVKVSRNDGTNLADYLLDGVAVNHVTTDSEGRKWFATSGGGVIATSSDGREILEEFTTSNSPLPDDVVYGIGFNSDNNSLMFSTAQGYAEYSLPVSSYSSTKEDIRAYPNPVRPGYAGYVTITDIPQGSFVKITDSAGNLVKELGIMTGFEILWDVSDANFNKVKSGVYHIMVSPSNENSKYSTVGKILVVG